MTYESTIDYDPMMDEFAQTRGADDLFFDDDFTPIAEPVVEQSSSPAPAPAPPSVPQGPANGTRRREAARGGRGRAGKRGGGIQSSVHATPAAETPTVVDVGTGNSEAIGSPTEQTPHKEGAVRGDRSRTGGLKRTKLTEAELSEKMASISLKNSLLTAAHERAEADLASFEAREAQAAQQSAERRKKMQEKQKIDRMNRAQMMGEREKNAQRKLEAVKGREWDFEKEEGFGGTGDERRAGNRRGAYGGVIGGIGGGTMPRAEAVEEEQAPPTTQSHRGGERGKGRGRGRGGRGGRGDSNHIQRTPTALQPQKPPPASDFPDLPTAARPAADTHAQPKVLNFPIKGKANTKAQEDSRPSLLGKQDKFGLPSPAGTKSWADQVEGA
ncbi:hypothetical protein K432DRAFT_288534 [Lepidopterella palustris CBS 459.81]|uniref:Uncharacterized protein n=1 Tax=Lepidopterella palustris CBS 459.81 TaxID=1314670 RepID=A0A8E2EIX6_9PEZI|nr:hypothetical protein K432DRAFT_288534 [Lepidopterella palustris CBS 459.81]